VVAAAIARLQFGGVHRASRTEGRLHIADRSSQAPVDRMDRYGRRRGEPDHSTVEGSDETDRGGPGASSDLARRHRPLEQGEQDGTLSSNRWRAAARRVQHLRRLQHHQCQPARHARAQNDTSDLDRQTDGRDARHARLQRLFLIRSRRSLRLEGRRLREYEIIAILHSVSVMQPTTSNSQSKTLFYVGLWLFFAYLYAQILGFNSNTNTNVLLGGMYFIEFGIHEASHLVTAFLPPIICASAGSIGEMSFTFLLAYAAYRAKSYFGLIFALLWVTLAMNSAGIYMADARAQQLQLVGAGPDPQHDWHFVFGQLGWLDWDILIGGTVRAVGDIAGIVGLAVGLVLIFRMFANKPAAK
jgi:hypothetical protein